MTIDLIKSTELTLDSSIEFHYKLAEIQHYLVHHGVGREYLAGQLFMGSTISIPVDSDWKEILNKHRDGYAVWVPEDFFWQVDYDAIPRFYISIFRKR